MMMTLDPSPTRPSAPKVATVVIEPKVATVGVQTEMSLDPKGDALLVSVIVEIVPECVDTEADVQSSRPELQESSGEYDEGYISETVCQEESSFCRGCGEVHCLCEDHGELRRPDVGNIINDIQDLVDNHLEQCRSDDDDEADIDDPVRGTGQHCARSNAGSDYHDDDSDDGDDEGCCDCEEVLCSRSPTLRSL